MGESQCQECGHITTGFEQQDFEAQRAMMEAKNAEIDRLRAGLTVIIEAGSIHGGAWCVAQARGYLEDLDFNEFPETGKP